MDRCVLCVLWITRSICQSQWAIAPAHEVIIKTGHVAGEIVKVAKSGKFDLIVMGAKGRSTFTDLLIGSVAQRVLSATHVPVTLIK
jgi:nucleotide-binding universal stress UspA family protein